MRPEADPATRAAQSEAAASLTRARDYAGAASAWRILRQSDPAELEFWKQEVEALFAARAINDARAVIAVALERFTNDQDLLLAEVRAAMLERRWHEAETLSRRINAAGEATQSVVLYLYEALARQGKNELARTEINAALNARKNDPAFILRAALYSLNLRLYPDAVTFSDQVLLVQPTDGDALWCRAAAHAYLGDLAEAETCVAVALKLAPQHILLPVLAAEVATLLERWDLAIERWSFLIAHQPARTWRRLRFTAKSSEAAPWLQLAMAQERDGDEDAAASTLNLAAQRFSEDISIWQAKARFAARAGGWEEAGRSWHEVFVRGRHDVESVSEGFYAAWKVSHLDQPLASENNKNVGGSIFVDVDRQTSRLNDTINSIDHILRFEKNSSGSIDFVNHAYVMPGSPAKSVSAPEDRRYLATGGVDHSDGRIAENSLQIGLNILHKPEKLFGIKSGFKTMRGTFLYSGGDLSNHIGHFTMECTGRFWYSTLLDRKIDGIIYIDKSRLEDVGTKFDFTRLDRRHRIRYGNLPKFVTDISAMFCSSAQIHVASRPTIVENLIVPQQLLGLNKNRFMGNTLFRSFIRSKVDAAVVGVDGLPRKKFTYHDPGSSFRGEQYCLRSF